MFVESLSMLLILISAPKNPTAEIVDPEAYVIKRFQEIIEDNQVGENLSLQEQLITQRAKLSIAKKRLDDLQNQTDTETPKYTKIRAVRALVSHHELQVTRLAKQIKKRRKR